MLPWAELLALVMLALVLLELVLVQQQLQVLLLRLQERNMYVRHVVQSIVHMTSVAMRTLRCFKLGSAS